MNRKLFWLGYLLALIAVAWIYWWRRQEEVEEVVQRLRQTRPGGMRGPSKERVVERSTRPPKEDKVRPVAEPPAKVEEKMPADDLQEISGIGPAFARRLQKAGITRFAQLAALSAHEVRELANLEPWQADVDSWIEQAQLLSAE